MTEKQRKIFSEGAEEFQENDEVVKQCLQNQQYTASGKTVLSQETLVFVDIYYGEHVVKLQWRKKLESQFLNQEQTFPDNLVPWRLGLLAGSGKRSRDCKTQFVQSWCLRAG